MIREKMPLDHRWKTSKESFKQTDKTAKKNVLQDIVFKRKSGQKEPKIKEILHQKREMKLFCRINTDSFSFIQRQTKRKKKRKKEYRLKTRDSWRRNKYERQVMRNLFHFTKSLNIIIRTRERESKSPPSSWSSPSSFCVSGKNFVHESREKQTDKRLIHSLTASLCFRCKSKTEKEPDEHDDDDYDDRRRRGVKS